MNKTKSITTGLLLALTPLPVLADYFVLNPTMSLDEALKTPYTIAQTSDPANGTVTVDFELLDSYKLLIN